MRENSSTSTVRRARRILLSGMAVAAVTVVGTLTAAPVAGQAQGPVDRSVQEEVATGEPGLQPPPRSTSRVLGPNVAGMFVDTRVRGSWSRAIRTGWRSSVDAAWHRQFEPYINTRTGWTGSVSGCRPGSNSSTSIRATQQAINFVRSLNGLGPVNISPWMSRRAMQTALMMDANDRLSHYPTRSWRCHTWAGDVTAAKSNIALSYPQVTAGRLIDMYMDDRGWANTAVGHRRWILYPFTVAMGLGSTTTANALTVVGPTSRSRPNPRWTSWPSHGYFPGPLEPAGRWSLSSGIRSEDFSRAVVRVWKNGNRIYPRKYRVHNGYGMPTIVWQMPRERVRRGVYKVQVARITRPGVRRSYSHTYSVRIFSPSR